MKDEVWCIGIVGYDSLFFFILVHCALPVVE